MDFSKVSEEDTQVDGQEQFKPDPPPLVPGRVLHADADFYAYQAGYRWEEESLDHSINTIRNIIESARKMAGAAVIHLHLTLGSKAGRYEAAHVKEYQAQRSERAQGLTDRVSELRHYMANCHEPYIVPVAWTDREADDGLTQAMYAANGDGTSDLLTVMWSMDKDLNMAPGLHMDPKTYELTVYPTGYGECKLDKTGSSTKVTGCGKSFFFHQLLMGDTADNIPGLPFFSMRIVEDLWPTKNLLKQEARFKAARTPKQKTAARNALYKERDKIKCRPVGPARAYDYLRGCKTELQAFRRVREAYADHYGIGPFQFTSWRDEEFTTTAGEMLLEQARLLWMQRVPGEDVLDYFKEVAQHAY